LEFNGICGFLDVTNCLPDALAAFFTLAGEDWVLAQQLFPGVDHLLRQVVCVSSTFEIESHTLRGCNRNNRSPCYAGSDALWNSLEWSGAVMVALVTFLSSFAAARKFALKAREKLHHGVSLESRHAPSFAVLESDSMTRIPEHHHWDSRQVAQVTDNIILFYILSYCSSYWFKTKLMT
jgi:hypothetical protein